MKLALVNPPWTFENTPKVVSGIDDGVCVIPARLGTDIVRALEPGHVHAYHAPEGAQTPPLWVVQRTDPPRRGLPPSLRAVRPA